MQRFVVVFALIALMFVALATETRAQSDIDYPPECPQNSSWSPCGRVCEQTCADPKRGYCEVKCIPDSRRGACKCDMNYHRREDIGDCVLVEDC